MLYPRNIYNPVTGKFDYINYDPFNKGYYATSAELIAAYPTGTAGDWAIVGETDTMWIWDSNLSAWVDSGDTYTKDRLISTNSTFILSDDGSNQTFTSNLGQSLFTGATSYKFISNGVPGFELTEFPLSLFGFDFHLPIIKMSSDLVTGPHVGVINGGLYIIQDIDSTSDDDQPGLTLLPRDFETSHNVMRIGWNVIDNRLKIESSNIDTGDTSLDVEFSKGDVTLTDGQLISSTTTVSPFSIASTVLNTNLNADLLDGQHGSYYGQADRLISTNSTFILTDDSTDQTLTGNLGILKFDSAKYIQFGEDIPATIAAELESQLTTKSAVYTNSTEGKYAVVYAGTVDMPTSITVNFKDTAWSTGKTVFPHMLLRTSESSGFSNVGGLQMWGTQQQVAEGAAVHISTIIYSDCIDNDIATMQIFGEYLPEDIPVLKLNNLSTSPAIIAGSSTKICTNLNADLLDGQHGSYYQPLITWGDGLGYTGSTASVNVDNSTIEINSDALRVKADGINDTHIDWGHGTNQVDCEDIPIDIIGTPTWNNQCDFNKLFGSAGRATGGTISLGTGSAYNISAGTGFIKENDSDTDKLYSFDWTAVSEHAISSNTTEYVGVHYNSGSPEIVFKSSYDWDFDTEFPLGVVVNETVNSADYMYIINNPWWVTDGTTNIIQSLRSFGLIRRDEIEKGLVIGVSGTRNLTLTAGRIWTGMTDYAITAIDTSVSGNFQYYWYSSTNGWQETDSTQYSVTQWNDVTQATLQTINLNKYCNLWIYGELNAGVQKLAVLYPQAQYNTAAEAESTTAPTNLPPHLANFGMFLGRIIFKQGIDTPIAVESAFGTTFSTSVISVHNNLSGLQGGTSGEYYHLTSTEHSYISGVNSQSLLTTASPTFAKLTVDNIEIDGSTITGISDTNTVITAYAGKNITIESVTFDGGVVAGIGSLTVDNLNMDGNTFSSTSADITITPYSNSTVFINSTEDASLTDGTGGLQIGPSGGANIGIDGNEIIARNGAGAAGTLYLQANGGTVEIGDTTAANLQLSQGTTLKCYSAGDDKYAQIYHNDTDLAISTSAGHIRLNPVAGSYVYSSTRIYNAVYNDYADMWEKSPDAKKIPGMCYVQTKTGLKIANKKGDKRLVGICSDTFGFNVGGEESEKNKIPISVSGFVLAYVDKKYEIGTLLTCNKNGILTKASIKDKLCGNVIAKFLKPETNKNIFNSVKVNNRMWVKVL